MKDSCNIIRDLLPLYMDEVCSEDSKEIIEEHLNHCSDCQSYYHCMTEEAEALTVPYDANQEYQKASSLRAVKRKVLHKQIFITFIVLVLLISVMFAGMQGLKHASKVVMFQDNIAVSMVDGSLVGRLYGSEHTNVKIKRVSMLENGKQVDYLLYMLQDTKWNDMITSDNVFSEYVLCPKEKSADEIDFVYYYTGEYTGLESMDDIAFQTVVKNAKKLWEKET